MMPGAPRCAAVRYPKSQTTDAELLELRRRAWQRQGVLTVRMEDVKDDWLRQALENWAAGMYGPRENRENQLA